MTNKTDSEDKYYQKALGVTSGNASDLKRKLYLNSLGLTSGDVNKLETYWLQALGVTWNQNRVKMWKDYLTLIGYTPTNLNDTLTKFYYDSSLLTNPTADSTGSTTSCSLNDSATLDGSSSSAGSGSLKKYTWRLVSPAGLQYFTYGSSASQTANEVGTWFAELTVMNSYGLTDVTTFNITVSPPGPPPP